MRRQIINLFRFSDFKNYKNQYSKKEGQPSYQSAYQNENLIESSIDVKNYNLMLSLEKYNMSLYIIPPAIIKKSPNVFEIKKSAAVLGILFIPKTAQDETNWAARKSFNFRLIDIGKLLYAEPGSGKSSVISSVAQSKSGPSNLPQYSK